MKTMARQDKTPHAQQKGFSLIEMMVGLAIGMIVVLVMTQTLVSFEGQKRATSGTADAQTGGSIATFTIQRQLQMAGYGLAIFADNGSAMNCLNVNAGVDHDGDGGLANPDPANAAATVLTPPLNPSPVIIVDGGPGGNDTITIGRALGDLAGLPVRIDDNINLTTQGFIKATNNIGCKSNDVAFIVSSDKNTCAFRKVASITDPAPAQSQNVVRQQCATTLAATSPTALPDECKKIYLVPPVVTNIEVGGYISCPGEWLSVTYQVRNGNLEEVTGSSSAGTTTRIIMSNVVSLQAQYGIASLPQNQAVNAWVNADGAWTNLDMARRKLIRSIRFVIVARNDLLERQVVTSPGCTAAGVCAWVGDPAAAGADNATVNLTAVGGANWNFYRYRVFETIVSLRNMTWASGVLR